jgi:hypothetical protein
MKQRRPGVRIEDERGNPVSFFQLKDMADLESRKKNASRRWGRRVLLFLEILFLRLVSAARNGGKGVVLNNLADIKSAGGVALRVRTQDRCEPCRLSQTKSSN